MWQKLGRSYPPQFELIPLLLLFLGCYVVWSAYPGLPDRIPSHFNFQGVPDGWSGKTSLLTFPMVGFFTYALLTLLNVLLAVLRDPRSIINLPEGRKAALTPVQVEALRVFLNRCLFALKTVILAMMTYLAYATIEVAMGRAVGLGTPFNIIVLGELALVGYMVWKSFSLTRPPTGRPTR